MSGDCGKTIRLEIGVWYNERSGHIHISGVTGERFISTVSPNSNSKRGNPHLFNKLAKCLQSAGKPAPQIDATDNEEP